MSIQPPLPPFTAETAAIKVRRAEDAWNGRNPAKVALAYTPDSRWRNRSTVLRGHAEIEPCLAAKWAREHEYRLIKELWATTGERIAVRFVYEYHDDAGVWWRAYGNENWLFDSDGLVAERHASINEVPIAESGRLFRWPQGPRPDHHPGLRAPGL